MTGKSRRFITFGYRPDLLCEGLSCWLDHARWLAAFMVAAAHLRNLLFPDVGSLALQGHPLSHLATIFYFFTLFGEQSVVLFFVMSGVLVGGTILRRFAEARFDAQSYAIDRSARLLVALVPALALSVALQQAGLSVDCHPTNGIGRIVANLFFLQNFTSLPLCNDHPLWSLSSEGWFYLIAPLLVALAYRRGTPLLAALLVSLAPAVICFTLLGSTPLFGLLLWLAGLLPWFVTVRFAPLLLSLPLAGALLAGRMHLLTGEFLDRALIALAFALLLSAASRGWTPRAPRFAKSCAGFSYSLYLVHMPIAQAVTRLWGRQSLRPSEPRDYLLYFAVLAFIVAVAWCCGRLFEDRTGWLRDRMRSAFAPRPTLAAATDH